MRSSFWVLGFNRLRGSGDSASFERSELLLETATRSVLSFFFFFFFFSRTSYVEKIVFDFTVDHPILSDYVKLLPSCSMCSYRLNLTDV